MANRHPPRLDHSLYRGNQRYAITVCCDRRRRLLCNPAAREIVLLQLRRTSADFGFAVVAYCQMPDHLHLVVEGERDDCDLLEFIRIFKQVSAFVWKQRTRERLWQASFYDHVLRDSESTRKVVRYVLENPVRAGLVTAPGHYPHSGSFVYRQEELMEWAFGWSVADR